MLMEMYMKVNLKMIKLMDMENILVLMEINMKVGGRMI